MGCIPQKKKFWAKNKQAGNQMSYEVSPENQNKNSDHHQNKNEQNNGIRNSQLPSLPQSTIRQQTLISAPVADKLFINNPEKLRIYSMDVSGTTHTDDELQKQINSQKFKRYGQNKTKIRYNSSYQQPEYEDDLPETNKVFSSKPISFTNLLSPRLQKELDVIEQKSSSKQMSSNNATRKSITGLSAIKSNRDSPIKGDYSLGDRIVESCNSEPLKQGYQSSAATTKIDNKNRVTHKQKNIKM